MALTLNFYHSYATERKEYIQIHRSCPNPALRVIYSSGYSPEISETVFVFREGTNFLQKPYGPHKLAKAVRDCLEA